MPDLPATETVGDRVRHLASLAGLTLEKLSEAAGLARTTLTFVAGSNGITGTTAVKLSEATGATAGWIVAREGRPPSEATVRAAVKAAQAKGAA